jgi:hypothetical protein
MSSDLVQRLRLEWNRNTAASKEIVDRQRREAADRIEALEAELAVERGTADRALMARDKAKARAERLREFHDAIKDAADLQTAVDMANKALEDEKQ